MEKPANTPFFARLSFNMFNLITIFFILYMGRSIIVPLIYATIIAILLNPVVNFLVSKKVPRIAAIALSLLLAIILVSTIVYFISSQASLFSQAFPALKEKFTALSNQIVAWTSHRFNIPTETINKSIDKTRNEAMQNSTALIGQTLSTVTGLLVVVFLLPVYIFMILYYEPLLLEFIRRFFGRSNQEEVGEVLQSGSSVIQNYLVGLMIEAAIIAVLNSLGLIILGIDYAILLGVIGAILNMIPYIGGIIAIAMPMAIALVTKSVTYSLLVFVIYMVIQFIDNHYIIPKIVASKVRINALVSLVVILIAGAFWGVPGMFLALPLTGIVKVVFDHIEPLNDWGYLLGDKMPNEGKPIFNFGRQPKVNIKKESLDKV